MGFIYKITNQINQKSYIGKTEKINPNKRFTEHIQESKKDRCKNRPLYRAFNKYGIENFNFEVLEETDEANERERYYIQKYHTYGRTGYNATLGGDGKTYIDKARVLKLLEEGKTTKEIVDMNVCCADVVRDVAKANNIILKERNKLKASQSIKQYDLKGNFIQDFPSMKAAMRWCYENGFSSTYKNPTHISNVCKGERKTAYKHIWKYAED